MHAAAIYKEILSRIGVLSCCYGAFGSVKEKSLTGFTIGLVYLVVP